MHRQSHLIAAVCAAALVTIASGPAPAQPGPKFLAPADQNVAIRAGRMFDSRSGMMLNNQVILIRGDKIVDVGPNLTIPVGARVIDLSNATVMPGMTVAFERSITRAPAGTATLGPTSVILSPRIRIT